jgi:hypothetical protein
MGWTVLYIAFGIVALWLLGEVLLQYKARLRWRLLAFVGFLCVVTGVVTGSIVIIVLGAVAFAVGQTYVTLSFRRGFTTGWALGGKPGASRRRKSDPGRPVVQEPTLQVSDVEYEESEQASPAPDTPPFAPPLQPASQVYEPEPMPEETGQYGVYGHDTDTGYGYPAPDSADSMGPAPADVPAEAEYASASAAQGMGYGTGDTDFGYDAYPGHDQQQYGYDAHQHSYDAHQYSYDAHQYGYDSDQYGYATGQEQYAAYSANPYPGTQAAPGMDAPGVQDAGMPGPDQYDPYGAQPQYAYPPHDPYASVPYDSQTPPGGVWMPPQRATESHYSGDLPPEQPYSYPPQEQPSPSGGYDPTAYDNGYNEQQYRY